MITTEQLEALVGAGAQDDSDTKVLDIITSSSMYRVAQEKAPSLNPRETAVPETAKNP